MSLPWLRQRPYTEPGGQVLYVVRFLVLSAILEFVNLSLRHTWFQRFLIDVLTIKPSAFLLDSLLPHAHVISKGNAIFSDIGGLSVEIGCEGIDGIILIASAVIAFQSSVKSKILGVLLGAFLMYALNQVRIVILFFVLGSKWFYFLHGLLLPTLTIGLGILFFHVWSQRVLSERTA